MAWELLTFEVAKTLSSTLGICRVADITRMDLSKLAFKEKKNISITILLIKPAKFFGAISIGSTKN